ncbi:hypothetical protein COB55_02010 [Candidatus Wolfebacteria bacterium]|nr:MAG: hypothetical protein COB55_02010 [Candidatus Wolfebacteria bacterium]
MKFVQKVWLRLLRGNYKWAGILMSVSIIIQVIIRSISHLLGKFPLEIDSGDFFEICIEILVLGVLGMCVPLRKRKDLHKETEHYPTMELAVQIMDGLPFGCAILDHKLRFVAISETLAKINGKTVEEHIGKYIGDVLPLITPLVLPRLKKVLEGIPSAPTEFKAPNPKKRGEESVFLDYFFPIRIKGQPGVYITVRDITEEELKREQTIQEEKMDSIGYLAGGIAHDFNNMLSGIFGYTELLLLDEKDSEKIKILKEIIAVSEKAAMLPQRLLSFGKKVSSVAKAIELNKVVHGMYKLLKPTIDASIELQLMFGDGLHLIDADSAQIDQLIMNLCLNAAQAMPKGGTLSIQTKNVILSDKECAAYGNLCPGDFVQLSITDTGIGMTDEVQRRIFEPFYTTKQSGSHQGSGLGLPIVYRIVKENLGFVHVVSRVDEGTRFVIYFPKGSKKMDSVIMRPLDCRGDHKGTILIVEDEKTVADVLAAMLQRLGYKTFVTGNGNEGVKLYSREHTQIDGVILDIRMPQMGGKEAFEKMQEINGSVKALLTTGYGHIGQEEEMLNMGVSGILDKPYTMQALAHSLENLLS